MALSMLYPIGFVTFVVVAAIPGSESSNFPLDDCARTHMDILALFYQSSHHRDYEGQFLMHELFTEDLSEFSSNVKTPQVTCASVEDTLYSRSSSVKVSDWQFGKCIDTKIYGSSDEETLHEPIQTVQELLKSKIKFVGRLFSEMSGVRQNATRIAVIYMDCSGYLLSEVRNLPNIVQQQSSDIKIFLVLFNVVNLKGTIHLSDALLPLCEERMYSSILLMAMCKQCIKEGFLFEHNDNYDYISCYTLYGTQINGYERFQTHWSNAEAACYSIGTYLAGIETRQEIQFLQTWLEKYFSERLDLGEDTWNVYIGLKRDMNSIAKRFRWSREAFDDNRPLVVNNWMPGKPSLGYNKAACGMWQFVWDRHKNNTNLGDGFVQGWADVECRKLVSRLALCELVLPRRLEDINVMRINPANKESFNKTLSRLNFKPHGDNIVSVSVHIENTNSLTYLNQPGRTFPIFDCGENEDYPRFISYFFVCDHIDDCSNRRDETTCIYQPRSCTNSETTTNPNDIVCEDIHCCDGSCLLPQWINDGQIDCTVCMEGTEKILNDENVVSGEACPFKCKIGTCTPLAYSHDGAVTCNALEGPLDNEQKCLSKYHIASRILAPRCVSVKDRFGAILGCRDVSHLEDCKDFQCSEGFVKCPNTYCIPQHYVLDGSIDCPSGEDEQNGIIDSCSGNFACWNSKMCLHPDLVCDGHPHCPRGDDEMDCEDLGCLDGLICVSSTVTVSHYNRSIPLDISFLVNRVLKYVDFSGVTFQDFCENADHLLEQAIFIILSNCQIRSFDLIVVYSPIRAQKIDISYNLMQTVIPRNADYKIFQSVRHLNFSYNKELVLVDNLRFTNLETLDLSHTGLSYIKHTFLVGMPNLKHLNLSFSLISDWPNIFSSKLLLQTLDLRGLFIENIREDLFNGLIISQHLYTDTFEMCCPQIRGQNIPDYTCHSPEDSISSCFDLVRVPAQRVLLWVVAVLAVLGNMTVIVYRSVWDRSVVEAGYGLFVTNLGISDIIMGVYLLIIAGADYYYRGIYVLYDKVWRESIVCKFAGFLATLSLETSTFFIFLITLDRFLVIMFPFGQIKLSKISRVIALLVSWIIGFLLALIPVVFKFEIYSTNAMCLGLPLTIKRLTGWEYSFGLFIVYNFIMFLIIACGQIVIYRSMSQNRITRLGSAIASRRSQDIMVAKQLSLVALSNFLCWFPVGIMGLLTLGEHEISNDVYAWITVIVLPINSAGNPLLYTIPALVDKWEKYRSRDTSSHRRHT